MKTDYSVSEKYVSPECEPISDCTQDCFLQNSIGIPGVYEEEGDWQ